MSGVSDLEAKTFRQEIELLKRLQGNQRIVKLIDYEERMKSDGTGQELLVVMEKGSRDLGNLIKELSGNHYPHKAFLFSLKDHNFWYDGDIAYGLGWLHF